MSDPQGQAISESQKAMMSAIGQEIGKVLMTIVPQAFSSASILTTGEGEIDEWKLSKISGRSLLSIIYFRHRGVNDNIRFYREFADLLLRGSKSIEALGLKTLENIAIGLAGGGGQKKLMKKPGLFGRLVTNRDWKDKATRENAYVIE